MRRARILLVCLLFLGGGRAEAQGNGGKRIVGIMPTFDTSGDSFGQQFAQNLTAMVYDKLGGAPFEIVLLNPGGLYSPLIPESMLEYTQSTGVDSILVTTLLPTDKPQKGDFILHVEAKLLDAQNAKELGSPSTYSAKVSRNDALLDAVKGGLDYGGSASNTVRQGRNVYTAMARTNGSRPFEKQPLGKAALGMAASIHSQMLAQVQVAKGRVGRCAERRRLHDQHSCGVHGEEGVFEGLRHSGERRESIVVDERWSDDAGEHERRTAIFADRRQRSAVSDAGAGPVSGEYGFGLLASGAAVVAGHRCCGRCVVALALMHWRRRAKLSRGEESPAFFWRNGAPGQTRTGDRYRQRTDSHFSRKSLSRE